jgi:hypothetical protein
MTVHAFREMTRAPADAGLIIEIFGKLVEFRRDYDETVLHDLAVILRARMSEPQADKAMCDALAMDNEIRFRLPAGLSLREEETGFPCTDTRALMKLIAHAGDPDHSLAAAAAEELGVQSHRILRKCASVLALSLAHGGLEIGWADAPTKALETRAAPGAELHL